MTVGHSTLTTIHLSLIFGFFKCLPFRVCLISLADEIQFMLISSRHICIRSIKQFNPACIYSANRCFEQLGPGDSEAQTKEQMTRNAGFPMEKAHGFFTFF